MSQAQQVVVFNGHKYKTSILMQNGKVAPKIDIAVKDLASYQPGGKIVGLVPDIQEAVVTKIDGKYHVLCGTVELDKSGAEIVVHFMSSVNLKKARIDQPVSIAPQAPQRGVQDNRTFNNRNTNQRPTQIHRTSGRGR